MKILIAEDDEDARVYLEMALVAKGYQVVVAANGAEALQLAHKNIPDLIISDVMMPEMDGFELCRKVKTDDELKFIPFVFYTATYLDAVNKKLGLSLGASRYLEKPIGLPEFLENIAEVLNEHKAGSLPVYEAPLKEEKELSIMYQSTLSKKLEEEVRALKEAKEMLEQRVEERTAELARANVLLQEEIVTRTESEKKLGQSEQRFNDSLESAQVGVWDWNIQTDELYWSDQISPLFGYDRGELDTSYQNFINSVHPDDRDKVQAAVKASVEQGNEYSIEHRVVWPDGSVHWLLERGGVNRDESGKPLHMLGVVQDVSKRVQAEISLRSSEELFRDLYVNSPVPYYSLNDEGFFIEVNQSFVDKLVYSRDEIIGRHYSIIMTKEFAEMARQRFIDFKNQGSIKGECDFLSKDGKQISVELEGRLAYNPDGSFKQTHNVWWDITERKQAQEALQKKTDELAVFNESMVGREMRIIELKQEVNQLASELGQKQPYPPVWR